MAKLEALGRLIQKALFTSTFKDLSENLEGLERRIKSLEKKMDERVEQLHKQLQADKGREG